LIMVVKKRSKSTTKENGTFYKSKYSQKKKEVFPIVRQKQPLLTYEQQQQLYLQQRQHEIQMQQRELYQQQQQFQNQLGSTSAMNHQTNNGFSRPGIPKPPSSAPGRNYKRTPQYNTLDNSTDISDISPFVGQYSEIQSPTRAGKENSFRRSFNQRQVESLNQSVSVLDQTDAMIQNIELDKTSNESVSKFINNYVTSEMSVILNIVDSKGNRVQQLKTPVVSLNQNDKELIIQLPTTQFDGSAFSSKKKSKKKAPKKIKKKTKGIQTEEKDFNAYLKKQIVELNVKLEDVQNETNDWQQKYEQLKSDTDSLISRLTTQHQENMKQLRNVKVLHSNRQVAKKEKQFLDEAALLHSNYENALKELQKKYDRRLNGLNEELLREVNTFDKEINQAEQSISNHIDDGKKELQRLKEEHEQYLSTESEQEGKAKTKQYIGELKALALDTTKRAGTFKTELSDYHHRLDDIFENKSKDIERDYHLGVDVLKNEYTRKYRMLEDQAQKSMKAQRLTIDSLISTWENNFVERLSRQAVQEHTLHLKTDEHFKQSLGRFRTHMRHQYEQTRIKFNEFEDNQVDKLQIFHINIQKNSRLLSFGELMAKQSAVLAELESQERAITNKDEEITNLKTKQKQNSSQINELRDRVLKLQKNNENIDIAHVIDQLNNTESEMNTVAELVNRLEMDSKNGKEKVEEENKDMTEWLKQQYEGLLKKLEAENVVLMKKVEDLEVGMEHRKIHSSVKQNKPPLSENPEFALERIDNENTLKSFMMNPITGESYFIDKEKPFQRKKIEPEKPIEQQPNDQQPKVEQQDQQQKVEQQPQVKQQQKVEQQPQIEVKPEPQPQVQPIQSKPVEQQQQYSQPLEQPADQQLENDNSIPIQHVNEAKAQKPVTVAPKQEEIPKENETPTQLHDQQDLLIGPPKPVEPERSLISNKRIFLPAHVQAHSQIPSTQNDQPVEQEDESFNTVEVNNAPSSTQSNLTPVAHDSFAFTPYDPSSQNENEEEQIHQRRVEQMHNQQKLEQQQRLDKEISRRHQQQQQQQHQQQQQQQEKEKQDQVVPLTTAGAIIGECSLPNCNTNDTDIMDSDDYIIFTCKDHHKLSMHLPCWEKHYSIETKELKCNASRCVRCTNYIVKTETFRVGKKKKEVNTSFEVPSIRVFNTDPPKKKKAEKKVKPNVVEEKKEPLKKPKKEEKKNPKQQKKKQVNKQKKPDPKDKKKMETPPKKVMKEDPPSKVTITRFAVSNNEKKKKNQPLKKVPQASTTTKKKKIRKETSQPQQPSQNAWNINFVEKITEEKKSSPPKSSVVEDEEEKAFIMQQFSQTTPVKAPLNPTKNPIQSPNTQVPPNTDAYGQPNAFPSKIWQSTDQINNSFQMPHTQPSPNFLNEGNYFNNTPPAKTNPPQPNMYLGSSYFMSPPSSTTMSTTTPTNMPSTDTNTPQGFDTSFFMNDTNPPSSFLPFQQTPLANEPPKPMMNSNYSPFSNGFGTLFSMMGPSYPNNTPNSTNTQLFDETNKKQ